MSKTARKTGEIPAGNNHRRQQYNRFL